MPAPKGNQYAKGNKGGGRKTKYREEFCGIAERLVQMGHTDEEIASVFDVSHQTLLNWKHEHQEFSRAMKLADEQSVDVVERSLFRMATGYERTVQKACASGKVITVKEYFPPQVGAANKFLSCRRKDVWADKEQRQHAHTIGLHEGLRALLEEMGERSRQRRLERAKLIEHEPSGSE